MSLEDAFWSELRSAAEADRLTLAELICEIDEKRGADVNLSSACRLYVLNRLKSR